jgi:hypothetical protein
MTISIQPYEARSFRFVELLTIGPSSPPDESVQLADRTGSPSRTGIVWRMKLYGIAWHRELPRPELLEAARRVTTETLAKETANNYKVGFVGAHDGRNACFVFVDFWGNENELFHRVFLSRGNDPQALTAWKISDSSVCVWDLRLQSFEREAWIKHVLKKPDAPDFDSYLQERMNSDA